MGYGRQALAKERGEGSTFSPLGAGAAVLLDGLGRNGCVRIRETLCPFYSYLVWTSCWAMFCPNLTWNFFMPWTWDPSLTQTPLDQAQSLKQTQLLARLWAGSVHFQPYLNSSEECSASIHLEKWKLFYNNSLVIIDFHENALISCGATQILGLLFLFSFWLVKNKGLPWH